MTTTLLLQTFLALILSLFQTQRNDGTYGRLKETLERGKDKTLSLIAESRCYADSGSTYKPTGAFLFV